MIIQKDIVHILICEWSFRPDLSRQNKAMNLHSLPVSLYPSKFDVAFAGLSSEFHIYSVSLEPTVR
jgi:hypothetical protein